MTLSDLGDDALGVILEGLRNPIDPRDAVGFGSVSHRLRALTQAHREQLRTEYEAAAVLELCHKLGLRGCKELREARKLNWENKDLFAPGSARRAARRAARRYSATADLTTLGTLGSVLPRLLTVRLYETQSSAGATGPDGVQRLAAGLGAGALPSVDTLSLDMHMGDAGAEALAAAFGRGALPRLRMLFLNDAGIGDVGLVALAPALRRQLALARLNLSDNPFGDAGLAALVAPLPPAGALPTTTGELKKLKTLSLSHTQVSDAGCATLASALDSGALPALEILRLQGSRASAAGEAAVDEALKRSGAARASI